MTIGLRPIGVDPIGVIVESGIIGTETQYLGSEDYVSRSSDEDANRHFRGVVQEPLDLTLTVLASERVAGRLGRGVGTIQLATADGALDSVFATHGIDGRMVTVKALPRGGGSPSLNDAVQLFQGAMRSTDFSQLVARLNVTCCSQNLDLPLQSEFYGGSGGADGGADLEGKPKPMAFGKTFGVTPIYLGVISGKHTYQVAGHKISDVPAFYDRGVALTKVAGTPVAGQYSVTAATGIVTIGGTVPELPTCDVDGYVDASDVFPVTTADIVEAILLDFAQVSNTSIDSASFATLNDLQPAAVGVWAGTETVTGGALVLELLVGIGGYGGVSRQGKYVVGQLSEPAGAIRAVFDEKNITGIQKLAGPAIINPPTWRHTVGYQRNYTVTTDVASGATETQRSFMAKEYREDAAADTDIVAKHVLSETLFTPALFAESADALTEAQRLLALYGQDKSIYEIMTMNVAPQLDIGQTVEATYPRFGLNHRLGTIVGMRLQFGRARSVIQVFA